MLSQTEQGKLLFASHNISPTHVENLVRSVSTKARESLESLGYEFELQVMLDVAMRENRKLFAALHKAGTEVGARQFIDSLGFKKKQKPSSPPPYYSFHVYGNKSALCISEATTRRNEATINIEGAIALEGNKFDWQSKIVMQFSPEELFEVLALLNGKITTVNFSGHGLRHDKSLEITAQSTNFFIRLIQRGRPAVMVPMPVTQSLNLSSLLYKQIKKNHPHIGMDELMAMLHQIALRKSKTEAS